MKVVLLTTSFPLREEDVSGIFVQRLATALTRHVDLTIIAPAGREKPDNGPYRLRAVRYAPRKCRVLAHSGGGIPDAIRRKDPRLIFLFTLIPALFLRTWFEARKADIVHGNWSIPSVIGALAARLAARPAVATLRGEDFTRALSSRIFRFFLQTSLRLNHYTICVSQAMAQDLKEAYPVYAEKIRFIPNGVSTVKPGIREDFRYPIRLLTVGSCIQRKRQDMILRAMGTAPNSGHFVLRIVGDGPLKSEIYRLAERLGISDHVELVGSVPPEEVGRHLEWADAFVLPSESEGRSNALMEAMAAELPVIASDIAGSQELVGNHCGFLFENGNTDDLAKRLDQVKNDPDAALAKGKQAGERIVSLGVTWDNCAENYLEIYQSAISYGK